MDPCCWILPAKSDQGLKKCELKPFFLALRVGSMFEGCLVERIEFKFNDDLVNIGIGKAKLGK